MSNSETTASPAESQNQYDQANDELMAKVEDFDFDFNEDFEGEIENEYKAILDWQFDNNTLGVSQPYEDKDSDSESVNSIA